MKTVPHQGRAAHEDDIAGGTPMVLTMNAYFQLLEHEELHEARLASKIAAWLALAAIIIAAIAVI